MNKLLTVSIAAYNVQDTINGCLNSLIIEKEYFDLLDIIVVNDGSNDRTLEIVNKYVNKYPGSIRLINKTNGGYGSTINTSIKFAKGKYYRLLDGDDKFINSNIVNYLDFLLCHDEDIILSSYVVNKNNQTKVINNHLEIFNEKTLINSINYYEHFAMHEIAIKRKILLDNKIKIEEKKYYTDAEFVFYCLKYSNNIAKYNFPIYEYYINVVGQSVSYNGIKKHYTDQIEIAKKIINESKENNNLIITYFAKRVVEATYMYCFIVGRKAKTKIINFDSFLKNNNYTIYKLLNSAKRYSVIRKTNFFFYSFWSFLIRTKILIDNINKYE